VSGFLPHIERNLEIETAGAGRNRRDVTRILESTEGLEVGEESRLYYDHSRQLTVTSFRQRVERCLFVFRPSAIANEDCC